MTSSNDCPREIVVALEAQGWHLNKREGWWHPTIVGMYYSWVDAATMAIRNSKLPDEE